MNTTFRPSKHGWPFDNTWPSQWIVTHTQIFGLPMAVPVQAEFGLCGGMCWSALDRYHDHADINPTQTKPSTNDSLFNDIVQRQTDSVIKSGMWHQVYDWQLRPDTGHWNQPHSLRYLVTKKEWPKLKSSIDNGEPMTLCLIRTEGYTANPTENHQVLAYGYTYNSATKSLSIAVYDPNKPYDDNVRLTMNFRGRFLDARQSTGEPLRGFFCVPYDKRHVFAKVSAMVPHHNGVIISFASPHSGGIGWGIYNSPNGMDVGGGGNTARVYGGNQVGLAMIPYKNGVVTAFSGGGIYHSPDGMNVGGGGNTTKVYGGNQIVLAMIPYKNGVVTAFSGGGIYHSPDGKNLGGGGGTAKVYAGQGRVSVMMPYQKGVITAFQNSAGTKGAGIYHSPDGMNVGGGGNTTKVYGGNQIVLAMIPYYKYSVVTAFSDGGIYRSPDGKNLGGGGHTTRVYDGVWE